MVMHSVATSLMPCGTLSIAYGYSCGIGTDHLTGSCTFRSRHFCRAQAKLSIRKRMEIIGGLILVIIAANVLLTHIRG